MLSAVSSQRSLGSWSPPKPSPPSQPATSRSSTHVDSVVPTCAMRSGRSLAPPKRSSVQPAAAGSTRTLSRAGAVRARGRIPRSARARETGALLGAGDPRLGPLVPARSCLGGTSRVRSGPGPPSTVSPARPALRPRPAFHCREDRIRARSAVLARALAHPHDRGRRLGHLARRAQRARPHAPRHLRDRRWPRRPTLGHDRPPAGDLPSARDRRAGPLLRRRPSQARRVDPAHRLAEEHDLLGSLQATSLLGATLRAFRVPIVSGSPVSGCLAQGDRGRRSRRHLRAGANRCGQQVRPQLSATDCVVACAAPVPMGRRPQQPPSRSVAGAPRRASSPSTPLTAS